MKQADVDNNVVSAWSSGKQMAPRRLTEQATVQRDWGEQEVKQKVVGRLERKMAGTMSDWKATQRNWREKRENWRVWGANGMLRSCGDQVWVKMTAAGWVGNDGTVTEVCVKMGQGRTSEQYVTVILLSYNTMRPKQDNITIHAFCQKAS